MTTTCETPLFGAPPDYIRACGEPVVGQWDGHQHCRKHLIDVAHVSSGDPNRCQAVDPKKDAARFGCYAHHICSRLEGHPWRHHCYCDTRWGPQKKTQRHSDMDPAQGPLFWLCLPLVLVVLAGKVAWAWVKTKMPSRPERLHCKSCGWTLAAAETSLLCGICRDDQWRRRETQ